MEKTAKKSLRVGGGVGSAKVALRQTVYWQKILLRYYTKCNT